mgnify:CR=1 FL=1
MVKKLTLMSLLTEYCMADIALYTNCKQYTISLEHMYELLTGGGAGIAEKLSGIGGGGGGGGGIDAIM